MAANRKNGIFMKRSVRNAAINLEANLSLSHYVLVHIIAQPQTVRCGVFEDETIPTLLSPCS